MKAEFDFWVWLVIIAIAGISKLFGKQESSDASGPPINRRARPRQQQPVQQKSMKQPLPKYHRGSTTQPASSHQQRTHQQPTVAKKQEWQATQDQVRSFLEEIQRRAVSQQNQPPIVQRQSQPRQIQKEPTLPPQKTLEPKRQPTTPPVIKKKQKPSFRKPPAVTPAATPLAAITQSPTRASRWAQAFRDRQNIRNIIVATEILGPPKTFQYD